MARRVWLFCVVAAVVSLIAAVSFDLWAGWRANVEFARLEKRYGSLDGRSAVASRVPDADNSARYVRAAAALVVQPNVGYAAMLGSVTRVDTAQPPAVPNDAHAFVDANEEAIRLAGEAVSRRQASWDADYAGGGNVPRLLGIRLLGNAVYLDALLELRAGRIEEASHLGAAGLAVAASLRNEPALIVQLIRISIATQAFDAVKRLIERSEPSQAALEELARALEENRRPDPLRVGLLAELRQVNADLMGRYFSGPFRREYLLGMERLIDMQSGPRPRPALPAPSLSMHWFGRGISGSANMISGLERAVDGGDTHNSMLGVTRLGVALRRYRMDRGNYPDELAALVPGYLPWLPDDPATGKPPVYARRGAGFTLKAQATTKDSTANAVLEWVVDK
jgi:hypothetical protein